MPTKNGSNLSLKKTWSLLVPMRLFEATGWNGTQFSELRDLAWMYQVTESRGLWTVQRLCMEGNTSRKYKLKNQKRNTYLQISPVSLKRHPHVSNTFQSGKETQPKIILD